MGASECSLGREPQEPATTTSPLRESPGGATEAQRGLWGRLSPRWGSRSGRGGVGQRPGADAPGYVLPPLRGFSDRLQRNGRGGVGQCPGALAPGYVLPPLRGFSDRLQVNRAVAAMQRRSSPYSRAPLRIDVIRQRRLEQINPSLGAGSRAERETSAVGRETDTRLRLERTA